jgi:hypothetical protein
MAPLIMVSLPTVSSFFSTCGCFVRGGRSPSGDLPPISLSLACGWPPGANGSLPIEWWRLQAFRVKDPSGARKGGSNRLGRTSARFGRPFVPVGPQVIMHFAPSTCMILTMSSLRLRWRFSSREVWSFMLLLTPKFGTVRSLICGPNLVKNLVQRRKVSSKGFGRGTCGRQFASVRQRDCMR